MKERLHWIIVVAVLAVAAITALTPIADAAPNAALATLRDRGGAVVGSVRFQQRGNTVTVTATIKNIPAGFHGFHVHDAGVCDPAAVDGSGNASPFFSAGPHFKEAGQDHPSHDGDLPVLLALDGVTQSQRFLTNRFTVAELLDGNATALIVHGLPDDYTNPTTGNAGPRIVCGVVSPANRRSS